MNMYKHGVISQTRKLFNVLECKCDFIFFIMILLSWWLIRNEKCVDVRSQNKYWKVIKWIIYAILRHIMFAITSAEISQFVCKISDIVEVAINPVNPLQKNINMLIKNEHTQKQRVYFKRLFPSHRITAI